MPHPDSQVYGSSADEDDDDIESSEIEKVCDVMWIAVCITYLALPYTMAYSIIWMYDIDVVCTVIFSWF